MVLLLLGLLRLLAALIAALAFLVPAAVLALGGRRVRLLRLRAALTMAAVLDLIALLGIRCLAAGHGRFLRLGLAGSASASLRRGLLVRRCGLLMSIGALAVAGRARARRSLLVGLGRLL